MDVHISVIADFKNLFPTLEITDWCLSGHAWVFNRSKQRPKHIHSSNWVNINSDMISQFQAEHDEFLKTFDGFICGHPNGFIPIFEKYGKPIIMINTCRYDLPYCYAKNPTTLTSYKECLHRLHEKGLLIAVSNNKADQLYTKLGCGIETKHIPSLCAYTGIQYKPTRKTFLAYHGNFPDHPLITKRSELGKQYKWSDISEFRGIIHAPYEVSMMSMFEHFSAGMPLFFPSKQYMLEKVGIQSISAYWKSNLPHELEIIKHKTTWIHLADFYEVFKSPNVYYFDSVPHLIELLERFEWHDDSAVLQQYRDDIHSAWKDVLNPHFVVPAAPIV